MSSNATAPPRTSREPEMSRVFEKIADGYDYPIERIDGSVPTELRGTRYRNGPGRNEIDGHPFGHLFDDGGMLSPYGFHGTFTERVAV